MVNNSYRTPVDDDVDAVLELGAGCVSLPLVAQRAVADDEAVLPAPLALWASWKGDLGPPTNRLLTSARQLVLVARAAATGAPQALREAVARVCEGGCSMTE